MSNKEIIEKICKGVINGVVNDCTGLGCALCPFDLASMCLFYSQEEANAPIRREVAKKWLKENCKDGVEVMEKNFREVIADIKEGEVWETIDNDNINKIWIDENNCIKFEIKLLDKAIKVSIKESKYRLQRKEYTFLEALKSYEEGKEIESCYSRVKFKDGLHKESEVYNEWKVGIAFELEEVKGMWYINE